MSQTYSVRVSDKLSQIAEAYLARTPYLNRSEFLRHAIMEKLERDAPNLLNTHGDVAHQEVDDSC